MLMWLKLENVKYQVESSGKIEGYEVGFISKQLIVPELRRNLKVESVARESSLVSRIALLALMISVEEGKQVGAEILEKTLQMKCRVSVVLQTEMQFNWPFTDLNRKLAGYVASQDTTEERYESIFDVAANRFSRAKPLAMEGGVDNGRKIMRVNTWDRRGEESGQEARRIKQQVVAGQAISARSTEKVQNRFNNNNISSAPNRQADQR